MAKPVKHLLLDFGGVCLLNPVELHRRVERVLGLPGNTLTWLGPLDPSTDDRWRQLLAGEITEREYWHQRAADIGEVAHRGDDWTLRAYLTLCYDEPEDAIIRPGAVAIVRDAKAAGRKVGVLTNDLLDFHGQEWVDKITFFRTLDALTDASRIGVMKPDPRAYAQALEDLQVGKDEVVFVDDQIKNVEGARAFGLTTVYFDVANPEESWRETRALLGLGPSEGRGLTTVARELTAAAAHAAVDAAIAKGRALGCRVNCAVVDAGGNLLAFLREPGAPLHSIDIAIDKAYTAASFRCATTDLYAAIDGSPDVRAGILARPRLTAFGGGLPLIVDGAHVGGIGVSGAAADEDVACAEAGRARLTATCES